MLFSNVEIDRCCSRMQRRARRARRAERAQDGVEFCIYVLFKLIVNNEKITNIHI